jgi:hypothetical protein
MEQSTDPKKKLKGLLKQAAHAVDPSKAVHSELTSHTDLLESIDEILKQPLKIEDTSKPIQVKVVQEPSEHPVNVTVTNPPAPAAPFPEKIQMEWSGSPAERAAQFFSLLQGMPGKDSVVPGPKGDKGDPGKDSKVPGPRGLPGPAGKDSTVPGPKGDPGKDAEPPKIVDLVKAVIAEIKKTKALDISNIRNTESIISTVSKVNSGSFMFNGTRYKIEELMHGGGGSGGGSFTILTATGDVNESNKVFGFSTKPSLVISDGISYTEKDNAGNQQWTWDTVAFKVTLVTPSAPTTSILAIQ